MVRVIGVTLARHATFAQHATGRVIMHIVRCMDE